MDWIDEEARFASPSFNAADFAKETFVECEVKEVCEKKRGCGCSHEVGQG